jgi:hypothetical protein
MRHIILHHHIFKNAGSTLDSALERFFGLGFATLHDNGDDGRVDATMLFDFIGRRPDARAISSHHFHAQDYDAAIGLRRLCFFHFAMIRRPLARFLSIYKFYRRSNLDHPIAQAARTLLPSQFVRLLIERHPHMIDNPQVNVFANHGTYRRPVSDADFATACARVQQYSLCAPVERYDEAMVTVEYFVSPAYGLDGLDLSYVRQNTSEFLQGEEMIAELIGRANFDWLACMNERDERLWNEANADLERRMRLVPDFERRLAHFRGRCAARSHQLRSA